MQIALPYSSNSGWIEGYPVTERRLSQLQDLFADQAAYTEARSHGDPLVYRVTSVEPGRGEGDLNYALGVIEPGKIGDEYYLTRGHIHAWPEAAEVYICLRGQGMMLLQDVHSGEASAVQMGPNNVVYVPGHTAHRTINTGVEPLVYWGIYPSRAGHDYQYVQQNPFRLRVVERDGQPVVVVA